ncbi:MAG: endonuclease [bacterium]|nr:endonuclease [bacterium]
MVEDFSDNQIKRRINRLYGDLLAKHGNPTNSGQWGFWCKRPKSAEEKEKVIIESILTQRTKWKNVEIAVEKLQQHDLLSLEKILLTSAKIIENLIKPAGFYMQKATRLRSLAHFFIEVVGGIEKVEMIDTPELRKKLLQINGVGNETADDILLYAFERPVFVVDEYTRRFAIRHMLSKKLTYDYLQQLFEKALKKDYKIYQDYHALIVIEMKGEK